MPLDHCQLACPSGTEETARAFYCGVLGFTEMPKPVALAGRGGCWFTGYGAELHLGVDTDFRPARKAHPAIRVPDLDRLAARIRTSGQAVAIDETEIPGRRRFHAVDPYGNRLEFVAEPVTSWPCGANHRIRRARKADVPAIVTLLRDDILGREREDVDLDGYFSSYTSIEDDPHQFLAVVTDADDRVVGTGQLTLTPTLSRGGMLRATLEAVRIAAELRGQGVGSAFVRWAAAWAKEQGAGLLQLTSDTSRTQDHAFYARLDFVASHVGMKLPLR